MKWIILLATFFCVATSAQAQPGVVTKPLVDGYVIDIPTIFEIKPDQYVKDRDAPRLKAGDTGRYLLISGMWNSGFQFAYLAVRIQDSFDKLYPEYQSVTVDGLRDLQSGMLERLKPQLDKVGARVIEQIEPELTVNSAKDKIITLRYRRQDPYTTTLVGQMMVIRPERSLAVIFSHDERFSGDHVNRAVSSLRRR